MIEIVFAIAMLAVIVSLLFFIAYRESEYRKETEDLRKRLSEQPYNLQKIAIDFVSQRNKEFDSIFSKTFDKHLKHIQSLEKMIVPKKLAVKEKDIADILSRTPELSEHPFKNDIEEKEEDGVILNEQNFARVPLTADTKIQFEGDDITSDILD